MKTLGMIGCEGRHALHFGRLFNQEDAFPGYEVTHIWGQDAPELLAQRQRETGIKNACESWREVIDHSDAVLIIPRRGDAHFAPAEYAIKSGKPVFVDKPFTLNSKEADRLIELADHHGTLLTGGSTLCFDPALDDAVESCRHSVSGAISYRADPDSPHGGYVFYASHLTDLCARVFGHDALAVATLRVDKKISSTVFYEKRQVLLHSAPEIEAPQIMYTNNDSLKLVTLDDKGCYRRGMEHFVDMLENGKKRREKWSELQFSVRLLNAILQSLNSGEIVAL